MSPAQLAAAVAGVSAAGPPAAPPPRPSAHGPTSSSHTLLAHARRQTPHRHALLRIATALSLAYPPHRVSVAGTKRAGQEQERQNEAWSTSAGGPRSRWKSAEGREAARMRRGGWGGLHSRWLLCNHTDLNLLHGLTTWPPSSGFGNRLLVAFRCRWRWRIRMRCCSIVWRCSVAARTAEQRRGVKATLAER